MTAHYRHREVENELIGRQLKSEEGFADGI